MKDNREKERKDCRDDKKKGKDKKDGLDELRA